MGALANYSKHLTCRQGKDENEVTNERAESLTGLRGYSALLIRIRDATLLGFSLYYLTYM